MRFASIIPLTEPCMHSCERIIFISRLFVTVFFLVAVETNSSVFDVCSHIIIWNEWKVSLPQGWQSSATPLHPPSGTQAMLVRWKSKEITKLNTCMCLINKCHENMRNRSSTSEKETHLAVPRRHYSDRKRFIRIEANVMRMLISSVRKKTIHLLVLFARSRQNNSNRMYGVPREEFEHCVEWPGIERGKRRSSLGTKFLNHRMKTQSCWLENSVRQFVDMVQFAVKIPNLKNDDRVNRAPECKRIYLLFALQQLND